MFSSQIRLTLRSLIKQGGFTLIHIVGLTLGLTCCLLVYLFINYELSFDNYHEKADRIYRITSKSTIQSQVEYSIGTPYPLGPALETDLPELEAIARIHHQGDGVIETASKERFELDHIRFADPSFFDLFDFELIRGSLKEAMTQPNRVVLTEKTAYQLFGPQNPIGEVIKLDHVVEATVAGLIKDVPENTHLPISMIFSLESMVDDLVGGLPFDSWAATLGTSTYVLLKPQQRPEQFKVSLEAFVQKYMTDEKSSVQNTLIFQPLNDIHFNSNYTSDLSIVPPIPPFYLWLFGLIGFLILIIACFNFVNLSTAQSIQREKEVGVRKVLGAEKGQLIRQFLGESLLVSAIAGVIALMISYNLLEPINQLLDKEIPFQSLLAPKTLIFLALSTIVVSLIAGLYPALGLAQYNPVLILSSRNKTGGRYFLSLRKVLVVGQFVITLGLILATLTIARQVNYMKNKDLGFDQSSVIIAPIPNQEGLEKLRTEWLRHPEIEIVSFCIGAPTSGGSNISTSYEPVMVEESGQSYKNVLKAIDYDYKETFDLQLVAGRWFTKAESKRADFSIPEKDRSFKFVVNEKLVKQLGYADPEEILGKRLIVSISRTNAEVIGVVKDFNTSSLMDAVEPTILMQVPQLYFDAGIRIGTNEVESTLAHIEKVWSQQFPDYLFNYDFLDERINSLYKSETRLFHLFKILAGVAILISCLGLVGLISFITKQRRKEIGIRKVLGASVWGIVKLLSKEFIQLIIVASIIAGPIAYYVMNNWLQNFAFRIHIQWWMFLLAGSTAIMIVVLTIGLQSVKAALLNPVDSIREE